MKKRVKGSNVVRNFFLCLLIVGVLAVLSGPATAADDAEEVELVNNSLITLNHFLTDPDMGYVKAHLKDCKGIIIVPSLIKAGFIWGSSASAI